MNPKVDKFCNQDYKKIKQDCLKKNTLFVDSEFSDFIQQYSDCEVKRPTDICKTPHFIYQDISRLDIQQGELGDCWVISAIIALTQQPKLLEHVVPIDQHYSKDYAGIFRFRFYQFDKWVEVVVDDRLLVKKSGYLKFARSTKYCEYWIALVEKAYAKLYGSYEELQEGDPNIAMEDFTGGIAESFNLNQPPNNLFCILYNSSIRESLLTASIYEDGQKDVRPLGLVKSHAYGITKVHIVHASLRNKVRLLRIKNPWADGTKWLGPWSDRSTEWNAISSDERKELGLVFKNDGEFWISFEDFLNRFSTANICHLTLDSLSLFENKNKVKWCRSTFNDSFENKKKYSITLISPDENDSENNCTLIISLVQKSSKSGKKLRFNTISIVIIDIEKNEIIQRQPFTNDRDMVRRFNLPPGRYSVKPESEGNGSYIIHMFTEQQHTVKAEANETIRKNFSFL